jgi:hypothetical protein
MNTKTYGVKHIVPEKITLNSAVIQHATKRQLLTAASLLDRSEDALNEFGWTRGEMGNTSRGFCTLGALGYAKRTSKFRDKEIARQVAEDALNLSAGTYVVNFNDSRARDRRVIKKWMRKTADRLRELATAK